jgi:hypothetical protein
LVPALNASGSATITVTVDDSGPTNNRVSRAFTVTVSEINQPPTLSPIANLTIQENAGPQTVSLAGITSGSAFETQTLTVTAVSSNPNVIAAPQVNYSSPGTTGTLTLTPRPDASGISLITVTVNDGGTSNNSFSRTFQVTVLETVQPPTLDPIPDVVIRNDAGPQVIALTGITSADTSAAQPITVTVGSSDPSLLPELRVDYASPSETGQLSLTPAAGRSGQVSVTVTVSVGQGQYSSTSRTFAVTVVPANQPPTLDQPADIVLDESSGVYTVQLTGVSPGAGESTQALTISAVSSNPGLVPDPVVSYGGGGVATLTLRPVSHEFGDATVVVKVDDGQAVQNVVTRIFNVVVRDVNQTPTLDPIIDLTVGEAGAHSILLSGISSGAATAGCKLCT